jgi:Protein of unknown function (DUF2795)
MNDDMTRARFTHGEGGPEARAKPHPPLASLLRQALQGAVYPLSSERLSRIARENAAPAELLTLLGGLPRGEFRSLDAVEFALEGDAQERLRAR